MKPDVDEFDIQHCHAKHRNEDMADCLSPADIFIFCPYVLFFRSERFCRHPRKDEIIERTENLIKQARGYTQIGRLLIR